MSDNFTDITGTSCPSCQSVDRISYEVIPNSQLTFTQDGDRHTHHLGPQRDYLCQNCDCKWLMADEDRF